MLIASKQRISDITPVLREKILSRMEADTADRFHAAVIPGKGFLLAAGRDLARRLGAEALCVPLSDICLRHREDGKPFFLLRKADHPERCPLFVSISHSGSWLLSVVSDKEVSCDIQELRHFPPEAVSGFFSREDFRYIRNSKDPDGALCRIWCRRECFIKLFGQERFSTGIPLCDTARLCPDYGITLFEEQPDVNVCLSIFSLGDNAINWRIL